MQHKPPLEVAKLAIRAKVCPKCYDRPAGSESLGPEVARTCEPQCTIFLSLSKLLSAVEERSKLSTEQVVHNVVCQTCTSSISAGDYCADYLTRSCPLSRYAADVLTVLDKIQDQSAPGAKPAV